MKASRYNLSTMSPDSSRTILFNTLYGTTALIEPEELAAVERMLTVPNAVPCSPHELELRDILRQGRYLIGDDVDEIAAVRNRKSVGMADPNRFDLIIMPNLDCNFACPYCYESHDHSNRMTDDVERSIKKWIANVIPKFTVMMLSWFGGEPTLSPERIASIGGAVLSLAKEHDVKLISHITTNGYALTEKWIKEYTRIGVFSYQITVDGPENAHNKTRVLASGKGSFRKVRQNIILLAKHDQRIKISLRVNYNQHNIHHIPELLRSFPAEIRSQLRVVYEPVFGSEALSATKNMCHSQISSTIRNHYAVAESLGYDVTLGSIGVGKLVYCYAERENQYIVNFNGDVFKCSVTDFDPAKRVGRIDADGSFVAEQGWHDWFGMTPFDKQCEACSFLPLCMGGCRKERAARGATGSYCNLVPSNTSQSLKSIAFGHFDDHLKDKLGFGRSYNNQREVIIASSV